MNGDFVLKLFFRGYSLEYECIRHKLQMYILRKPVSLSELFNNNNNKFKLSFISWDYLQIISGLYQWQLLH